MDFGWSDDQETAYHAALSDVAEHLGHYSEPEFGAYSRGVWELCGKLGLLGLCVPQEYGGGGLSAMDSARMMEAFGRGSSDMGLVFGVGAHLFACAVPIAEFATPEGKKSWLPGMCHGDLIAGNAMTERGAGTDIGALATMAVRSGSGYLLRGTKTFVSNGPIADLLVTYAVTDPAMGFLGITAFVVDASSPGITIGPPVGKMGLTSCPTAEVTFDDCWVSDTRVLGALGQGSLIFQRSMAWERCCLFAGYVGLLDRAIDECVSRARQRRQFGHPISSFQAVSHRIVDMKVALESARLLLYRACWQLDRSDDATMSSALAKLAVSESAVRAAIDAIRTFGADGYRSDMPVEAMLRDAVGGLIFSGTSDIQREIIARELGLHDNGKVRCAGTHA